MTSANDDQASRRAKAERKLARKREKEVALQRARELYERQLAKNGDGVVPAPATLGAEETSGGGLPEPDTATPTELPKKLSSSPTNAVPHTTNDMCATATRPPAQLMDGELLSDETFDGSTRFVFITMNVETQIDVINNIHQTCVGLNAASASGGDQPGADTATPTGLPEQLFNSPMTNAVPSGSKNMRAPM